MDALRPILAGLLGALIAGALLSWAGRGASERAVDGVIRYGRRMRVLALFMFGIALFIGYAALHAAPDQRLPAALVGGTLFTGGAWFVVEVFLLRVRVTESHLVVWSPWRGRRDVPWSAITGYGFSHMNRWHVLYTDGFGKVRLSIHLDGVDEVAERLESYQGRHGEEAGRDGRADEEVRDRHADEEVRDRHGDEARRSADPAGRSARGADDR